MPSLWKAHILFDIFRLCPLVKFALPSFDLCVVKLHLIILEYPISFTVLWITLQLDPNNIYHWAYYWQCPFPLSLTRSVWPRASLIFAQSPKAPHPSTAKDAWLQGEESPSLSLSFHSALTEEKTKPNFHAVSLSNQRGESGGLVVLNPRKILHRLSSGNPSYSPPVHNSTKTGWNPCWVSGDFIFTTETRRNTDLDRCRHAGADSLLWLLMLWDLGLVRLKERESLYVHVHATRRTSRPNELLW